MTMIMPVMWKGILLAYGRFTGGNTEYNHLPNGARIIVLDEGARTFTSWIRQKDGIVDKVTYPASFVKDDWTSVNYCQLHIAEAGIFGTVAFEQA